MKPMYQVINEIRATSSRKDKEALLTAAWNEGHRDLFKYIRMCYDNFITFGVKQVPTHVEAVEEVSKDPLQLHNHFASEYTKLDALLNGLMTRKLTGNLARMTIREFATTCEAEQWDGFIRLLLLKDMKAGFTDGTINRVLTAIGTPEAKKYIIQDRSCQLATDIDDVIEKYKTGEKLIDYKFDGVRIYTVFNAEKRTVTMHTRNGLLNENFPFIQEQFENYIADNIGNLAKGFVLDGEIIGNNFNSLMTQLRRKKDAQTDDMIYMLFDYIPLADFEKGLCEIPQEERDQILSSFIASNFPNNPNIQVVEKTRLNMDTEEGKKLYKEINDKAIAMGLEGIMIKSPTAPYECKRTRHWLKQKPFITVTLKMVGIEMGKAEGRHENTVGAVIFEGIDNDFPDKFIRAEVGSLTDKEREDILNNLEEYTGMLADITGDCLTQSKENVGTNNYSLRFPRDIKWREINKGEGKI